MSNLTSFGDRVRELRKARRLTQQQLADAIGVKFQTVSAWEKGHVKNPELEHIFACADALETDARYLALGHHDRLAAPTTGFPVSDTARIRMRRNREGNP